VKCQSKVVMIADSSMLLWVGDARGEPVLEKVLGNKWGEVGYEQGCQHVCCKVSKIILLES